MAQPLVSILVPIFNVEKYIGRCLDSIFSQSYRFIEYIFIDDNSPDNSINILRAKIFDYKISSDRYKILSHNINKGIASTRNDCLQYAQGEYVFFIDSDDWIDNDTIELLVAATCHSTIDIVGCDYMWEFESGIHKTHYEDYGSTCEQNLRRCINYEIGTVLWKLLIKRQLFGNGVRFLDNINIGEDYVMSIKLFYYAKSFVSLHKPFYHYAQFNEMRYSSQIKESIMDHVKAINAVEVFLKQNNMYDNDIVSRLLERKFQVKSYFLTKKMYDYNLWLKIFPESNYAYKNMGYNFKEKVKFWLAGHHLLYFYRYIL